MTRFVFDTNVIVSALLFNDSVPGQAFIRALNHGTILVSGSLVRELRRVLGRDRFGRYLSREERDEFLESLIRESDLIEITESVRACRDPEDDRVLELAVNGNATYIVTGDADLATTQIYAKVQQEHLRSVISKLSPLVPVLVTPENVTRDEITGKEKLNLLIS